MFEYEWAWEQQCFIWHCQEISRKDFLEKLTYSRRQSRAGRTEVAASEEVSRPKEKPRPPTGGQIY